MIDDETRRTLNAVLHTHVLRGGHLDKMHRTNLPRWRGIKVIKHPEDLVLYQQVISERRPDFIIETGTKFGGSSRFFADMCRLNGHGHVISIDIAPQATPKDDRITYIVGSSRDKAVVQQVRDLVGRKSAMASLDSCHWNRHVVWELHYYSRIVTPGQYLVVEDLYDKYGGISNHGPAVCVEKFLANNPRYVRDTKMDEQFLLGVTRDGWLLRR